MDVYFLFKRTGEDAFCTNIYALEDDTIYNFSVEEDYIVKSEESSLKSIDDIEKKFLKNSKARAGKSELIKKDFPSLNSALKYLDSSKEDFLQGIPNFKKLPKVVNPYDIEFDDDEMEGYDQIDDDYSDYDKDPNDDDLKSQKIEDDLDFYKNDDLEDEDSDDDYYYR